MLRCDELATITEEPGRITRRVATEALDRAAELVGQWMIDAGLSVRRDGLGGVSGRLEADRPSAPAILLGSHLDSVIDAGRYDGPLGVLTAVAVAERLARDGPHPIAIEVHGFADEEGVRFGTAYLSSSALAGTFDPTWLARTDHAGVSLEAGLRRLGHDVAGISASERARGEILAWLEVHIEQGPVLEAEGLPVAIVTGIQAQSRFEVAVEGTAGHAGTVPMPLRHDALAAAARFVLEVERVGLATPGLVATVGDLRVSPGAANVIPGRVVFTIDVRHADDEVLARASEEIVAGLQRAGVATAVTRTQHHPATPCSALVIDAFEQALCSLHLPVRHLASGAGHDAVALAPLCPVGMLFVRCAGGISHNPAESVAETDVAVAIDVLEHAVRTIIREATRCPS